MPALSAILAYLAYSFSFQFSLLFCALTQFRVILLDDLSEATLCINVMPYRNRALILSGDVFLCRCTPRTAQGKNFELILTVKMETRHPVGGPFGRELSAFVITAEL